jgi:hypothetical protein
MGNYEALFEDEENIFGGTPQSKFWDIALQASDEIVKDEFEQIMQKFAAMEQLLEKHLPNEDIDKLIANHIFENGASIDNHTKGLYVEFTGNIVMRLDS